MLGYYAYGIIYYWRSFALYEHGVSSFRCFIGVEQSPVPSSITRRGFLSFGVWCYSPPPVVVVVHLIFVGFDGGSACFFIHFLKSIPRFHCSSMHTGVKWLNFIGGM